MNAVVKLIIGLLIAIAGIYWYAADYIATGWVPIVGYTAVDALIKVFVGTFGLFLLFLGLLIAWIEYEDWKWEREERKSKNK